MRLPGNDGSALARVRVVAFDWGGTLVHVARQEATRARCAEAAVQHCLAAGCRCKGGAADVLNQRLQEALARTEQHDCLEELDTARLLSAWCDEFGLRLPPGAAAELAAAFWRPWIGCLDLIDGVAPLLAELKRRGFVIGLVSNCATDARICREELVRLGIAEAFAFTLFSSEIGVRKPHPRVYAEMLGRARVTCPDLRADEVLFVGDTPAADVEGPRAAGMRAALVTNAAAATSLCALLQLRT